MLELANGEVHFVHPLLASGVIAEATEGERRGAHRLVAGVVEEPVARARHVAAAIEEPDAEVAGRWTRRPMWRGRGAALGRRGARRGGGGRDFSGSRVTVAGV